MSTPTHKATLLTAEDQLAGCLLGTAVGDALGLPYEGLTPGRASRLLGPPDRYRLIYRFGMVSDDTEHAALVAEALLASGGAPAQFGRSLAWRLRWWFLCLPAAVGLATLRACVRLWLGFGFARSGVWSAGNGPAMRAPLLGAWVEDTDQLIELVTISSRITHRDPRAIHGAIAIAFAARHARRAAAVSGDVFLAELKSRLPDADPGLMTRIAAAVNAAGRQESTLEFANLLGLGKGVTGFILDTVPVVIHAWLSHPEDLHAAVSALILCGGDADTTAAIVGGLVGVRVGGSGIPPRWLAGIRDWPYGVAQLRSLGSALAIPEPRRTPSIFEWLLALARLPLRWLRSVLFLAIVLMHGFRRLLPPYG